MSDAPVSRGVYKFAVFALAIGAFAIGVTEFATMGLLPMIAEELGIIPLLHVSRRQLPQ